MIEIEKMREPNGLSKQGEHEKFVQLPPLVIKATDHIVKEDTFEVIFDALYD